MDDGLRMVQSRACGAWALPGDPTCAGVARRLFRQVASGLALEPEAIDDGVTMVSELAANTLHVAAAASRPRQSRALAVPAGRRPAGGARLQGLRHPSRLGARQRARPHRRPRAGRRDERARPRGRARDVGRALGASPVPRPAGRTGLRGKAVWFALPAPAADRDAGRAARAGEIPPPPARR